MTRNRRNRYTVAMEKVTPEAIVTSVMEIGKLQASPLYRVEAKMYVPAQKYSRGAYPINILEPVALVPNHMMDNGTFSFDSLEKIAVGRRFKIEITE